MEIAVHLKFCSKRCEGFLNLFWGINLLEILTTLKIEWQTKEYSNILCMFVFILFFLSPTKYSLFGVQLPALVQHGSSLKCTYASFSPHHFQWRDIITFMKLWYIGITRPCRERSLRCFCCWGLPAQVGKDGKVTSTYNPAALQIIYHLHKSEHQGLVRKLTAIPVVSSAFRLHLLVRQKKVKVAQKLTSVN